MSEINLTRTYRYPAHALWEQLTVPELFSAWCLPTTDLVLEKGRDFTQRTEPNRFWDGVFECTVEDFAVDEYLRYRSRNAGMGLDSVIEWTIRPAGDDSTALQLRHSGFAGLKGTFHRMILTTGWKQMLDKQLPQSLASAGSR
ncbi:SRPBCC family protein [Gordonia sp. (in: high G+C Gram-positive bacteria)]|uniref:SRPBCC family protein n=1 Tax=Gordonia sp. (in: high G+C Gram-positive bacteria) TaxID=84139 RepID=UPI0039E5A641